MWVGETARSKIIEHPGGTMGKLVGSFFDDVNYLGIEVRHQLRCVWVEGVAN